MAMIWLKKRILKKRPSNEKTDIREDRDIREDPCVLREDPSDIREDEGIEENTIESVAITVPEPVGDYDFLHYRLDGVSGPDTHALALFVAFLVSSR